MSDPILSASAEEAARPPEAAVILQAPIEPAPVVPVPVVPVPVVAVSPPSPPPPPPRPSEDQLPTTRLPSLPAVFPEVLERALAADPSPPPSSAPMFPPSVPSVPSIPPAISSLPSAAAREARTLPRAVAARSSWRSLLSGVNRVAATVPGRVRAAGRAAWSQRRVGVVCGVLGLAMIVGALVFGVYAVASARIDKPENVSLAVAIVVSRAALAIAAMFVGSAMLRMAERLSFPAAGLRVAAAPPLRRIDPRN